MTWCCCLFHPSCVVYKYLRGDQGNNIREDMKQYSVRDVHTFSLSYCFVTLVELWEQLIDWTAMIIVLVLYTHLTIVRIKVVITQRKLSGESQTKMSQKVKKDQKGGSALKIKKSKIQNMDYIFIFSQM